MFTNTDEYLANFAKCMDIAGWTNRAIEGKFADDVKTTIEEIEGNIDIGEGCSVVTRSSAFIKRFESLISTEVKEHIAPIVFRNQTRDEEFVNMETRDIFPKDAVCIESLRIERVDGDPIDITADIDRMCFTYGDIVISTRYANDLAVENERTLEKNRSTRGGLLSMIFGRGGSNDDSDNHSNTYHIGSLVFCSPNEPLVVLGEAEKWAAHFFIDPKVANDAKYRFVATYRTLSDESLSENVDDEIKNNVSVMRYIAQNHLVQRICDMETFAIEYTNNTIYTHTCRLCLNFSKLCQVITLNSSEPASSIEFVICHKSGETVLNANITNMEPYMVPITNNGKFVYQIPMNTVLGFDSMSLDDVVKDTSKVMDICSHASLFNHNTKSIVLGDFNTELRVKFKDTLQYPIKIYVGSYAVKPFGCRGVYHRT